ncbi:hypothetical protein HDZ31DRAFT_50708, partial [Schizophyllum fasciatum]
IEHFEYYCGLCKGDIDLASPLNHMQREYQTVLYTHIPAYRSAGSSAKTW